MNNFSSGDAEQEVSATNWTVLSPQAEKPEDQEFLFLWKILPPCIILLGGFGNIATIFVMHRIKDHNSSQHAIFMALAVSDVTVLLTDATNEWMKHVFRIDLRLLHRVVCKLWFMVTNVSATMSAWLVTCVTVQRTMAVLWPHRMRVMCTVRRTWIVIAILAILACCLYFHSVFGFEISEENRCRASQGTYRYFLAIIFSWIYSCMVSVLPSVCQFVCDTILSVTLFKAVSSSSLSASATSRNSSSFKTDKRKDLSYRTTVMVLAISCAFLVLTLPQCLYLIWASYIYQTTGQYPLAVSGVNVIYLITQLLWHTNSAINFYLYCLTGAKFRREFVSWICCDAQSSSAPSVQESASEASRGGGHPDHANNPLSK